MTEQSKNIKDYLIEKTSKNIEISPEICDKVIEWVYKEARKQVKLTTSLEFTGFGTYLIYPSKLKNNIRKKTGLVKALEKSYEANKDTQYGKNTLNALEYSRTYLNYLNEQADRMDRLNSQRHKKCSTGNGGDSKSSETGERTST